MENEKLREIKLSNASKYTVLTLSLMGAIGLGAIGINNLVNPETEQVISDGVSNVEGETPEEIVSVKEEKLERPFTVNAQVKTYYYDLKDEASIRENALVFYNGSYTPSIGMNYFYNNQNFDVVASFSGEIIEKKVDPMYGVTIYLKHNDGLVAVYSSLSELSVNVGDKVKQGDVLAKAGTNTIDASMGNHLNFSLLKKIYRVIMSYLLLHSS
jgi:stage II sporulation protein Q